MYSGVGVGNWYKDKESRDKVVTGNQDVYLAGVDQQLTR